MFKNGTTIFIVEDEVTLAEIYKTRFERAGFQVTVFNNGLDFVNGLTTHIPDIILLDINMPEMNGFEAIKTIQQNFKEENRQKVHIIIWSNSSNDTEIQQMLKNGVSLFLKKVDYSGDDLVDRVKKFLDEGK